MTTVAELEKKSEELEAQLAEVRAEAQRLADEEAREFFEAQLYEEVAYNLNGLDDFYEAHPNTYNEVVAHVREEMPDEDAHIVAQSVVAILIIVQTGIEEELDAVYGEKKISRRL